jgi:hypothetical protein
MAGRASKSWCLNLRESRESADEFPRAEAAVPISTSRLPAPERRLLERARVQIGLPRHAHIEQLLAKKRRVEAQ